MTDEKPLFIPLKTEHYNNFANGTKTTEYRKYGARWNESVCRIGRRVTISKGYGKKNRLYGVVVAFGRMKIKNLPGVLQEAICALYADDIEGTGVACIGVKLDVRGKDDANR